MSTLVPASAMSAMSHTGLPDPTTVQKQKETYIKLLDSQLAQGLQALDLQLKQQRDAIQAQAEQQKKAFAMQVDMEMKAQELQLQQQYQEQTLQLQQQAQNQKSGLEQQAMQLAIEFQQRRAEEEMHRQQSELERQQHELQMKLQNDFSEMQAQLTSSLPSAFFGQRGFSGVFAYGTGAQKNSVPQNGKSELLAGFNAQYGAHYASLLAGLPSLSSSDQMQKPGGLVQKPADTMGTPRNALRPDFHTGQYELNTDLLSTGPNTPAWIHGKPESAQLYVYGPNGELLLKDEREE